MRSVLYYLIFLTGIAVSAQKAAEGFGYDYIPDVADSVIEARLKAIEADIPLHFSPEVKKYINFYTITRRDYARRMLNRSSKYFPLFEEYLAKNNMPDELKYLSVVESGLNPNAVSHAAAVGLWQFIYWTGKKYNLNSSWYIDDRIDPDMSTQSACDFLGFLHGYFGDWELALAGYNSGPGRVNRSIRYADGQRDFRSIYKYLPNETKAYVPKFVAVTYVFNYAEEHNLYPDASEYLPLYDTIHVSQYLHLETFANQANICIEDLELLNPQIKHGAIPSTARNYPLKIPIEFKDSIVVNRQMIYEEASKVGRAELEKMAKNEIGAVAGRERVIHKVRSGDVLGTIAERYHVRVSDIKKWNRLKGSMIRVGQSLKIWVLPKYKNTPKAKTIASKPKSASPKPKPGQKTHFVKKGDSLWGISVANKISIEKLKILNNLSSDNIKPGQTLIVSAE
ncbi:MAG: LysM peptidoglycan-binding domain-containing protein [Cytophagales bacterium]|nr:LysM peptidoglycan-binding domain-containing protein [Cytophagales bacterium]